MRISLLDIYFEKNSISNFKNHRSFFFINQCASLKLFFRLISVLLLFNKFFALTFDVDNMFDISFLLFVLTPPLS
jgi:hypothetical protein